MKKSSDKTIRAFFDLQALSAGRKALRSLRWALGP